MRLFVAYLISLMLLACEDQIVNECGELGLEGRTVSSSLSSIQNEVFDVSCATAGCHSGSNSVANLNLEKGQSYTNLVNVDAVLFAGEKRIISFDSRNSILIKILRGELSPQMPLDTEQLSATVIDSIAQWIDNGALNN